MRLGYVILYVPDVATTLAFYEAAFGLSRRFLHESGQYGEMETGATALAFVEETFVSETVRDFSPNRADRLAAGAEVGLVAADVTAAFAQAVAAGATPHREPLVKPWGQTVAYVRDLNGFLVELCSDMGAA